MSFEIKNTTDKKNTDGVSLMIYGKSGVGKTSLVNTLDPKSTLVINIENGIAPLNKGIAYIDINTISEIEELPRFMAQAKFSTIVIDSLSYLTEIYLMHYPKTKNNFESYQELQRVVNLLVYNILQLVKLKKNIVCIQKESSTGEPWLANNKLQESIPYMFDHVMQMNVIGNAQQQKRTLTLYKTREQCFRFGQTFDANLTEILTTIYKSRS